MFEPKKEQKATNVKKKRKKPVMPSTRVKHIFEEAGYTTQFVERFVPHARRRYDFLGCGDVMAMCAGKPLVLIQTFTTQWNQHRNKIILGEEPAALEGLKLWLQCGKNNKFIFVGFHKRQIIRGQKRYKWFARYGRVKLTKKGNIKLIEVDTLEEAIK